MLPIVFCNVSWPFEFVHLCLLWENWRWVHSICLSSVMMHIEYALCRSHSDLGKLPLGDMLKFHQMTSAILSSVLIMEVTPFYAVLLELTTFLASLESLCDFRSSFLQPQQQTNA